jgi:sec-independent protein translocase protein TatA
MGMLNNKSAIMGINPPGIWELVMIFLIVLVVFGHNRIPQLGEALGKGIRNFRKSFNKDETEAEASRVDVRQVNASEASRADNQTKKTDDSTIN